jgi:hypothetical protein
MSPKAEKKRPTDFIDAIDYMRVQAVLSFRSTIFYTIRGRDTGVRHSGHPIGDYAKYLFAKGLRWTLSSSSSHGYDATLGTTRYLIRGRRFHLHSNSRDLATMRRLPERRFDFLAAVLFNENHSVYRAAIIPHALIEPRSRYSARANAWTFELADSIWELPGVHDVTHELAQAATEVDAS